MDVDVDKLGKEFDARLRRVLDITDDSFPVLIEVVVYTDETFKIKTFKGAKEMINAMDEAELEV